MTDFKFTPEDFYPPDDSGRRIIGAMVTPEYVTTIANFLLKEWLDKAPTVWRCQSTTEWWETPCESDEHEDIYTAKLVDIREIGK